MTIFVKHHQLSIRPFVESDKSDFIDILQHRACMKYSITGVLSKQQADDCFNMFISNKKHKMYAIEDLNNGTVIGCTGLQDCFIDETVEPSFILRLLPDFHYHQDLLPVLQPFIKQLIVLYQLPYLQAVVAKNNQFSTQLMADLNFEKIKAITCRGIDSYLHKTH